MGESITERMNRLAAEQRNPQRNTPPVVSSAARSVPDETDKDELRRARTHRLVQIGALTDQYLGSSALSPEEVGELLAKIALVEQVRRILQARILQTK